MPPKPRRRRLSSSETPGPLIEFRAIEDDAWYSCSTRIEEDGGCYVDKAKDGLETYLRVMFSGFLEANDQRFPAGMFVDTADIKEFRDRFRPLSKQLQDWECRDVVKGTKVCASSVLKGRLNVDEVKFYDAVVVSKNYSGHKFDNGKEVCTCMFKLLWSHGPHKGSLMPRDIEAICIVQEKREPFDLIVDYFLTIATKKLSLRKVGFHESTVPKFGHESHNLTNGSTQVLEDVSMGQRYEGSASKLMQIMTPLVDLGGSASLWEPISNDKEGFYFIVVENMEMNMLPEIIVDFIQKQTSIHTQAVVFPSFYSEEFSRGVIYVDTREKIVKIVEFFGNPEHLIVSLRGRPWVMAEKKYNYGSIVGSLPKFQIQSRIKSEENVTSIDLVRKGTKEFEKGKRLYDLFLGFHKHVQGLHQSLRAKENELFDS